MGGKEGGRGYLYQGIVAVLEALERPDLDRIFVEFPTVGDKVDIALRSADEITDAIQVKSTANSFETGELSKWLIDIITDYPCQRYHLILIGRIVMSSPLIAVNPADSLRVRRKARMYQSGGLDGSQSD